MSEGGQELKAGHPPAVKAGGMRVVTKHRHKEQDPDAFDEKYKDTVSPIGGPVKVEVKQDAVAMTAGVEPAHKHSEAIKSYHDKPHPSHEKPHSPGPRGNKPHIQQPRKN